jgi:O-antigen/teichoic acid export membrane protein
MYQMGACPTQELINNADKAGSGTTMLRYVARGSVFTVDKLISHVRVPLYRNAYALMLSTAATSALGMLYWVLAARYYPADIVGLNAAAVSMMTFLAGAAQGPSMNAMLRYIPVAGRDTKRLVAIAYFFSVVIAVVVGGGFLLSVDIWTPALNFLRQDLWLAIWFLLGVIGWCIFALQDNVLTGLRETIFVPIENIPYAIAKIGLLVVFATTLTNYGILASWTVPMLMINYLLFSRLIPRYMEAKREQTLPYSLRQIAHYITGNYVALLFQIASMRLLPVVVTNLAGSSATAYFYLPWTIATSLRLIISNMSTSFTVELAADSKKMRAFSYRFLLHTTAVLIVPILVLLVGAPYILQFSGADYAAEGTLLMRLLTLSALPNVIISLHVGIARVQQKVSEIVGRQFALCVLTLGLSYYFLQVYGITGVGIGVLTSEIVVAIVLLFTSLWPIVGAPLVARIKGDGGSLSDMGSK